MMERLEKYQKMLFVLGTCMILIFALSELLWNNLRILVLPLFCFGGYYIFFAAFWGNGENNDQEILLCLDHA
jgi:hypothetical protein